MVLLRRQGSGWERTAFVALTVFVACSLLVAVAGCTPKVPVDTNGDRIPDTEMGISELEAWRANDRAATEAAARRVKRDAERAIKAADAGNVQAIDSIKAEAEDSIDGLAIDFASRESVRAVAIEDIERQASIVTGILNDPAIKSAVGNLPIGGAILTAIGGIGAIVFGHRQGKKSGEQQGSQAGEIKGWDDGFAAGLAQGKQAGIAEGKDIGWQEREDYQAKIDSTWEEASSRGASK